MAAAVQCHTPFKSCPTLIATGWSCNGTNYSYPFGPTGGHYSTFLDDERKYDEFDRQYKKEMREEKEQEDSEAHTILKKEYHVPDPNIPRLGEFGPAKKILKSLRVEKSRKAAYKQKQSKSILKVDNKDDDDWLLRYMEEIEYWEYNNPEVVIAA